MSEGASTTSSTLRVSLDTTSPREADVVSAVPCPSKVMYTGLSDVNRALRWPSNWTKTAVPSVVSPEVGVSVGAEVGASVGCAVGESVGTTVGLAVGDARPQSYFSPSARTNAHNSSLPSLSWIKYNASQILLSMGWNVGVGVDTPVGWGVGVDGGTPVGWSVGFGVGVGTGPLEPEPAREMVNPNVPLAVS